MSHEYHYLEDETVMDRVEIIRSDNLDKHLVKYKNKRILIDLFSLRLMTRQPLKEIFKNEEENMFILTHVHKSTMGELNKRWDFKHIYCSKESSEYLKEVKKIKENVLKVVNPEDFHKESIGDITVFFIPNSHTVGALSLIINFDDKWTFYSSDFRYTASTKQSIRFFFDRNGLKYFDRVFLDCKNGYYSTYLPSKSHVIKELNQFILDVENTFPKRFKFVIGVERFGSVDLILEVLKTALRLKFHVFVYKKILKALEIAMACDTTPDIKFFKYLKKKVIIESRKGSTKAKIEIVEENHLEFSPHKMNPKTITLECSGSMENQYKVGYESCIDSGTVTFPYSEHSSMAELNIFIKNFLSENSSLNLMNCNCSKLLNHLQFPKMQDRLDRWEIKNFSKIFGRKFSTVLLPGNVYLNKDSL